MEERKRWGDDFEKGHFVCEGCNQEIEIGEEACIALEGGGIVHEREECIMKVRKHGKTTIQK